MNHPTLVHKLKDRKILRCTNNDQIRNIGWYLDKVKYTRFNKTKVKGYQCELEDSLKHCKDWTQIIIKIIIIMSF
jgi:hypothetical protein